jgi:hypothetical protein
MKKRNSIAEAKRRDSIELEMEMWSRKSAVIYASSTLLKWGLDVVLAKTQCFTGGR